MGKTIRKKVTTYHDVFYHGGTEGDTENTEFLVVKYIVVSSYEKRKRCAIEQTTPPPVKI